MTTEEYRSSKLHRKCQWCEHCSITTPPDMFFHSIPYYSCEVKNKVVNENIHRFFCPCFQYTDKLKQKDWYIPVPPPPLKNNKEVKNND